MQTINFRKENGYAVIHLNRPKQLNTFNETMHEELSAALDEVSTDNNIRAMLLTGEGRGFCAGQDLGDRDPRQQSYDLGQTIEQFYNPLMTKLYNLHKPKIIAVNGVAAGAGIGLALTADITLASSNAKFAMAFGKIGLLPDSGLTWHLVRLVGLNRAKSLVLTNAVLSAEEALALGLVWRVYDTELLQQRAIELTEQLAHGPQVGIALTIDALNQAGNNTLTQQLALEADYQRKAGYSADYKEGVSAFLEKREAIFYRPQEQEKK